MNFLTYVFIGILSLLKGFGLNSDSSIYFFTFLIGTFLLFFKIIRDKYTKKELFFIFLFFLIGVLTYFIGTNSSVLFTAVIICSLKNIDLKKVLKIVFFTRLISFLILLLGSFGGLINDELFVFYRDGEILYRHCLGYPHPNEAHLSFAIIVLLYFYLYFEKLNVFKLIVMGVFNLFLYNFTYSRTGCLVIFIVLVFIILWKYFERLKIFLEKFCYNSYLLFGLISFMCAFLYNKVSFINTIDKVLSGRIYYNNLLLNLVPTFFGKNYNGILVDNGYFILLYNCGIFAFAFYSYYYIKTIKFLYFSERMKELFFMTLFLFFIITESFFPNVLMNIPLVFIGEYVFNNRKDDIKC